MSHRDCFNYLIKLIVKLIGQLMTIIIRQWQVTEDVGNMNYESKYNIVYNEKLLVRGNILVFLQQGFRPYYKQFFRRIISLFINNQFRFLKLNVSFISNL